MKEIILENRKAVGVRLTDGSVIRAKKGVISNASIWDTMKLLPEGVIDQSVIEERSSLPQTPSFLHIHAGIDQSKVPEDLECHYCVVDDWSKPINHPGNVVIISIPSKLDPTLAPQNKHTIHAYTAGSEPYNIWEGLDRQSDEYKRLKEERGEVPLYR